MVFRRNNQKITFFSAWAAGFREKPGNSEAGNAGKTGKPGRLGKLGKLLFPVISSLSLSGNLQVFHFSACFSADFRYISRKRCFFTVER